MRSPILVVFLGLIFSACSHSSAMENLDEAYRQAQCERDLRCNENIGRLHFDDVDTCLLVSEARRGSSLAELLEFVLDHELAEFDASAFREYLAEMREGDCSVLPSPDFIDGLGRIGSECTRGFQCESGWCDGCPGVCALSPEVGDRCEEGAIFSCGPFLSCIEAMCVDLASFNIQGGDSCDMHISASSMNPCEEGFFCDHPTGTCTPFVLEGELALGRAAFNLWRSAYGCDQEMLV